MPLTLYLIALFIGGPLVLLSALGGDLDADVDVDTDLELDADVDAEADVGDSGVPLGLNGWLPFARARFWIFALFMVGLLGTGLTLAGELGPASVAGLALGFGLVAAVFGERAIRSIRGRSVSAATSPMDFIGAQGTVLLPVGRQQVGQIRVRVRGREIDLEALLGDDVPLDDERASDEPPLAIAAHQSVLVYELTDDGVALVQALHRG